jgi:N-methylhydantoinase A
LDKAIAAPEPTRRDVYFDGQFRDTPVFTRDALPAGFTREGPAIIEEFGSTTVVFPGQKLTVDPHGILIIRASG